MLTFLVSGSTSGTLSTEPGTWVLNAVPCVQWPFIAPDGLTPLLPAWLYIGWDSRRLKDLVFRLESLLQACPGMPEDTWFSLAGSVPFFRKLPVDDRLM